MAIPQAGPWVMGWLEMIDKKLRYLMIQVYFGHTLAPGGRVVVIHREFQNGTQSEHRHTNVSVMQLARIISFTKIVRADQSRIFLHCDGWGWHLPISEKGEQDAPASG